MKLSIAIVLAALSLCAAAPEPVTWKAVPPPNTLKPGARFRVNVVAQIQKGWHIYGLRPAAEGPIPTRIWIADGMPVQSAGAVDATEPMTMVDPAFGMEVQVYDGEVSFQLPLRLSPTVETGNLKFFVNASFQSCDNKICLPPKTVKLEVPVTVAK
jgi:thiol:disulfide interchange protein DsbD